MNKKNSTDTNKNVIKNPLRRSSPVRKIREPYQPEYSRLGLEPPAPIQVSPAEFSFGKKRQRTTENLKDSKNEFTKLEVQSGCNNREHIWYPSEKDDLDKSENYANRHIKYDEVPGPDGPDDLDDEFLDDADCQMVPCDLQNVAENGYIIVIDNEIIYQASSLEEIEELVESLIYNPESPYKGISLDDVVVFKRLELKFGVSIKNR